MYCVLWYAFKYISLLKQCFVTSFPGDTDKSPSSRQLQVDGNSLSTQTRKQRNQIVTSACFLLLIEHLLLCPVGRNSLIPWAHKKVGQNFIHHWNFPSATHRSHRDFKFKTKSGSSNQGRWVYIYLHCTDAVVSAFSETVSRLSTCYQGPHTYNSSFNDIFFYAQVFSDCVCLM